MNKLLLILMAVMVMTACEEKETMIEITTDYGVMKAKLYDSTPKHKENMIKLVKEGFYNDLLFHRVIKGFMLQGGDPQSRDADANARLGMGGPGYQIDAEIGALHFKGALAAARTGDNMNPERKSSGSQFYVVHGNRIAPDQLLSISKQIGFTYDQEAAARYETEGGAPFLDNQYTVFGEVVEGLDVIDKIAAAQTAVGDRPLKDIKMQIKLVN